MSSSSDTSFFLFLFFSSADLCSPLFSTQLPSHRSLLHWHPTCVSITLALVVAVSGRWPYFISHSFLQSIIDMQHYCVVTPPNKYAVVQVITCEQRNKFTPHSGEKRLLNTLIRLSALNNWRISSRHHFVFCALVVVLEPVCDVVCSWCLEHSFCPHALITWLTEAH